MSDLDHCTAWLVEPEQQAAIAAACAQHMQDCRVQSPDLHALIHRMADKLDHYSQLLSDDRRMEDPLAFEARAFLAAEPQGEGRESDGCRHNLNKDGDIIRVHELASILSSIGEIESLEGLAYSLLHHPRFTLQPR